MSLMTSHPGAKRLSSIQTGLMVSLSHWPEWKAVKWLCPGVNAVVIGVGTHVLLVLMENLPRRPLRVKIRCAKVRCFFSALADQKRVHEGTEYI